MNIEQLLKFANDKIDLVEAEIILSHVLKKPREFIIAHPEYRVLFFVGLKFKYFIWQRKRGAPVAYIVGHKEFFGLDFLVNKHTLIPRPETELLVEEVLKNFKSFDKLRTSFQISNFKFILIDVGTGSGCVVSSIVKLSNCQIVAYATDISKKALRVAKKNAKKHNVDINFLHGNLLEPVLKHLNIKTHKHLNNYRLSVNPDYPLSVTNNVTIQQCNNFIITANLPYLTPEQFKNEPSIQHEPKTALIGGKDGLKLYEELLDQIKNLLFLASSAVSRLSQEKVGSLFLILEIDPSQTKKIQSLIKTYLPNATTEVKKDLAGLDRLVVVKYE